MCTIIRVTCVAIPLDFFVLLNYTRIQWNLAKLKRSPMGQKLVTVIKRWLRYITYGVLRLGARLCAWLPVWLITQWPLCTSYTSSYRTQYSRTCLVCHKNVIATVKPEILAGIKSGGWVLPNVLADINFAVWYGIAIYVCMRVRNLVDF